MLLSIAMSFLATVSFSVLFNVPKKHLIYCGFAGLVAWMVYLIVEQYTADATIATFLATIAATLLSYYLARIRKTPITVFLIAGIITLVPGSVIYRAMYNTVIDNNLEAINDGLNTLKLAGAIALGIGIVRGKRNG